VSERDKETDREWAGRVGPNSKKQRGRRGGGVRSYPGEQAAGIEVVLASA
jgi:hypothetical protein